MQVIGQRVGGLEASVVVGRGAGRRRAQDVNSRMWVTLGLGGGLCRRGLCRGHLIDPLQADCHLASSLCL